MFFAKFSEPCKSHSTDSDDNQTNKRRWLCWKVGSDVVLEAWDRAAKGQHEVVDANIQSSSAWLQGCPPKVTMSCVSETTSISMDSKS